MAASQTKLRGEFSRSIGELLDMMIAAARADMTQQGGQWFEHLSTLGLAPFRPDLVVVAAHVHNPHEIGSLTLSASSGNLNRDFQRARPWRRADLPTFLEIFDHLDHASA